MKSSQMLGLLFMALIIGAGAYFVSSSNQFPYFIPYSLNGWIYRESGLATIPAQADHVDVQVGFTTVNDTNSWRFAVYPNTMTNYSITINWLNATFYRIQLNHTVSQDTDFLWYLLQYTNRA